MISLRSIVGYDAPTVTLLTEAELLRLALGDAEDEILELRHRVADLEEALEALGGPGRLIAGGAA